VEEEEDSTIEKYDVPVQTTRKPS